MIALFLGFAVGFVLAGASATYLLTRHALMYRRRWKEALGVIEDFSAGREQDEESWRRDWDRVIEINESQRERIAELEMRYRLVREIERRTEAA